MLDDLFDIFKININFNLCIFIYVDSIFVISRGI